MVGVDKLRANPVGGLVWVGDLRLGLLGASSLMVIRIWLRCSSVWFPRAPSVVGVNNRRVNEVDCTGGDVLVSDPGV